MTSKYIFFGSDSFLLLYGGCGIRFLLNLEKNRHSQKVLKSTPDSPKPFQKCQKPLQTSRNHYKLCLNIIWNGFGLSGVDFDTFWECRFFSRLSRNLIQQSPYLGNICGQHMWAKSVCKISFSEANLWGSPHKQPLWAGPP